MKYVIDASADIKTYVQEQDSNKAVRLRAEYHQGLHELIAPDLFPTEMCTPIRASLVELTLIAAGKIAPMCQFAPVTVFSSPHLGHAGHLKNQDD